jgi:predicted transcriptional regulator
VPTAERVSISAFVDPDDHERLVEQARAEDRSASAVIRHAIRKYLAEHREDDTEEER